MADKFTKSINKSRLSRVNQVRTILKWMNSGNEPKKYMHGSLQNCGDWD